MLDNQLIALIISTLLAGEITAGIPNIPIKQAYQPQQQGINKKPTAYLFKVGDRRVGFRRASDVWDSESSSMVHQELQQYETTFQISALSIQNPLTPDAPTASNILNAFASILQSTTSVATFEAQGVGVERVMNVRNPYFTDDKQRFEAAPSLDFIMTHKQIITSTSQILQDVELDILTV